MKSITEWILESLLIVIHFPSNLLKPLVPLDHLNNKYTQKYPIVLVERWFTRNVFHIAAKKYFEKKGFKVYSLNYSMLKGTFEDSAKNLKNFIDLHGIDNAVLVGISGGATTCLEYLQFFDGWQKTRLFISVGGSIYGSPLAKFLPISKSLRELMPNSSYMKHLHGEKIKNLDKIITIRARHDNMVYGKYATLPGAKNVTINVVGHNLLHTFWLPTYQKIYNLIESEN